MDQSESGAPRGCGSVRVGGRINKKKNRVFVGIAFISLIFEALLSK